MQTHRPDRTIPHASVDLSNSRLIAAQSGDLSARPSLLIERIQGVEVVGLIKSDQRKQRMNLLEGCDECRKIIRDKCRDPDIRSH